MNTNLQTTYESCCPGCGAIERLYHTRRASEKALRKLGWTCDRENVWTCPACKMPRITAFVSRASD